MEMRTEELATSGMQLDKVRADVQAIRHLCDTFLMSPGILPARLACCVIIYVEVP